MATDRIITKADIGADGYFTDTHLIVEGTLTVEAGVYLQVRGRIEAGWGIKAGWGIEAGGGIKAGGGIEAGWGIKAGGGIEAGWGIEAGEGIKAGLGIEAGEGIKAGLTITAKWLSVKLRIFAGICGWKIPAREEQVIDAEVRSGLVAHGVVVRSKETPA